MRGGASCSFCFPFPSISFLFVLFLSFTWDKPGEGSCHGPPVVDLVDWPRSERTVYDIAMIWRGGMRLMTSLSSPPPTRLHSTTDVAQQMKIRGRWPALCWRSSAVMLLMHHICWVLRTHVASTPLGFVDVFWFQLGKDAFLSRVPPPLPRGRPAYQTNRGRLEERRFECQWFLPCVSAGPSACPHYQGPIFV